MKTFLGLLVQILVILLAAPLAGGIIKKIKALTQKRKGAPILQMYFDLLKLFKKESVISDQASWIFRAAPYVVFASAVCAALFVPVSTKLSLPLFAGDAILVVYCLALGRFFLALAGMDTGSTFGGMGSSREMTIAAFIEPGLIVSLLAIGLVSKSTSIGQMMLHSLSLGAGIFQPLFILLFISMLITLIAETARIPVDDPATHLELTMVHEAMILEYSGRQLALMEWAGSVKQLLFITLISGLFLPVEAQSAAGAAGAAGSAGGAAITAGIAAVALSLLIYLAKVIFIAVLLGFIESLAVKLKFFSVPNLAVLSLIVALIGFMQHFVLGGA